MTMLGVADLNARAPGPELARRLNIPVPTDLRRLIAAPRLDLAIDVTGSPEAADHPRAQGAGDGEEEAQWAFECTEVGHPTESRHVMARVAHFQQLERRYIPGTDECLNGSAGFTEATAHETWEIRSGGRARRG